MDDQSTQTDSNKANTDTTETQVTESEIIAPAEGGQGQILVSLESMIKSHLAGIDRLQADAKKYKSMLDDIFVNDPTFQEHDKKAKEATKVKQQTRGEILKRPQAKELAEKVKAIKSEAKEMQDALSDYLQEYQRMSGVNEIESDDGEVREIVFTAKLVRRGSNYK